VNYKNLSEEFRPYVFIGAISGIIKHMDDTDMSAENALEQIRAELKALESAEAAGECPLCVGSGHCCSECDDRCTSNKEDETD
jgi:hypothetical protein